MMQGVRKHKYALMIGGAMLVSLLITLFFSDTLRIFDQGTLERFLSSAGSWGPLLLMAVVIVEVVIAPIPGGIPPVVAGVLYGLNGFFYVWVGNVIGSSIAFFLARFFGADLVRRIDPKFDGRNYHEQIQRLWFFYFIPLMPVDILSFAFGLSSVRFHRFILISSLGFFLSTGLLTLFGSGLYEIIF